MDDRSLALNNSGIGGYLGDAFLVYFPFSKKLPIVVVRDVCPSVCPSVRLSVCRLWKYFLFCGNSLSSQPIHLKIGLNVR